MKNAKSLVPALAVLLCVSLSCTFLKEKIANGGTPAAGFVRIAGLPPLNAKSKLVSPGAVAIRRLAETDPSVASFAGAVESAEQGAMKKTIDEIGSTAGKTDKKVAAESETHPPNAPTQPNSRQVPAAAFMFQSADTPLPGTSDGALVGMITGMFKSMLTEVQTADYKRRASQTETTDGTTSTTEVEFGGSADGSTSTDLSIKTESTKNGVKVTTEMQAKIEGFECPNAEGQVPITVKMRLSARSGSSGYTQDVTAFIRLVVGEDAEVATTTIDITQGTSRGRSGGETYVETGETIKFDGNWDNAVQSNQRVIQKTDNASSADVNAAMESGSGVAYGAAIGAIQSAKSAWQGGQCVKIEAASPGRVEPNSSHEIPVKVRHKKEGTEVPSKLDAVLSGETSVSPLLIPKTAGTLTYVAPSSLDKKATISLTANSRRGRAKLDLDASTGGTGYRVSGKSGPVTFSGQICSLDKAFLIDGTFANGSEVQSFTPTSSTSGTVNEDGNSGGCTQSGSGSYNVSLKEDGTGILEFTETVTGVCPPYSNTKKYTFRVNLTPDPTLSCP